MDAEARRALRLIQRYVSGGRYRVLDHFVKRLDARGMFWADVEAVIDLPQSVRDDGLDRWNRPKWILQGTATDGGRIELVCALDEDDDGELTVFITIYWKKV